MEPSPLLTVRGVVKTFPGVKALDGVDLEVRAGEVHCLLGQNGAGKSTLIKILAGVHQPDEGEIRWNGDVVTLPRPTAALKIGMATMYQELDLVDGLSIAANVYLGHEQARAGFPLRRAMAAETRRLLARLGHGEMDPATEVGRLSAAGKQIVSMARALSHDVKLIIMDEPSAVLASDEVDNLFRTIRDLTSQGVAVVYISHRLAEVRDIGDRVTVLKDGRTVARDLPAKTTPTREVVALMTGRDLASAFPDRVEAAPAPTAAAPLLQVEGLTRPREFANVSFTLRAGEILGLAGLVGSGRSEVLETVYGARKAAAGTVTVEGKRLRNGDVRAAVAAGMGLAPEERKSQGLFLSQSVARNITMSTLGRFSRLGWLDRKGEMAAARATSKDLDVRPADPTRVVRTLSGGNQQKAVVGRWLLKGCKVLILDEPTRGVDVGARAELYALIHELAAQGVGVLLVSSEIPEVLGLADRVLVLREGHLIHEAPASELTEEKVLDLVMEGSATLSADAVTADVS